MARKRILLAEADEGLRSLVCEILENAGFEPLASSSGAITLEILRSHRQLDCCFVDLGIDDLRTPSYLEELATTAKEAGFPLVLTSFSKEVEAIADRCHAASWLVKPYDLEVFLRAARRLSGA